MPVNGQSGMIDYQTIADQAGGSPMNSSMFQPNVGVGGMDDTSIGAYTALNPIVSNNSLNNNNNNNNNFNNNNMSNNFNNDVNNNNMNNFASLRGQNNMATSRFKTHNVLCILVFF